MLAQKLLFWEKRKCIKFYTSVLECPRTLCHCPITICRIHFTFLENIFSYYNLRKWINHWAIITESKNSQIFLHLVFPTERRSSSSYVSTNGQCIEHSWSILIPSDQTQPVHRSIVCGIFRCRCADNHKFYPKAFSRKLLIPIHQILLSSGSPLLDSLVSVRQKEDFAF